MDNGIALLDTKQNPPGYTDALINSLAAHAYDSLVPYPAFAFWDWKSEERGPLPKCMPWVRTIVSRSTRWLFGIAPQLTNEVDDLEKLILPAFKKLSGRLKAAARLASTEGAVALKWTYSKDTKEILFTHHSTINDCKFYYDPHNIDRLLMVRLQYPYMDAATGKYFIYREEWTETLFVKYKPREVTFESYLVQPSKQTVQFLLDYKYTDGANPMGEHFEEESRQTNTYGVIPFVEIKWDDQGGSRGMGQLWLLTQSIDRVNLTYHLMDRSNQYDSDPVRVFIDVMDTSEGLGRSKEVGSSVVLETKETIDSGARQGKAQILETGGRLRPHLVEYVRDLREQVHTAASSVEINQSDMTNKGNLTQSILMQLFAPLIEGTDERRGNFKAGIIRLLDGMLLGLSRTKAIAQADFNSSSFDLAWSNYFKLTEFEKQERFNGLIGYEQKGCMKIDDVKREVAVMEEIADIDQYIAELADYQPAVFVTGMDGKPVSDGGSDTYNAESHNLKDKAKSE